jgi:ribosome-binding factor A
VSNRVRKVNEQVREILAEVLLDVKDPRIGFVTLTDVRTTTDLKACEVFYTVLPDDEATRAATAEGLGSATPMLRRELGQRLRLRFVPDLDFQRDTVPEHGRHIEALLSQRAATEESDADDDR